MRAARFALLGDPVAHSRSPRMHHAAFEALGLPHTYVAIRATAAEVDGHVAALRAGAYDGLNVTVPHKERALALADEADPLARVVGAANTLTRARGGGVRAFNTDAPAVIDELRGLAPERGARWSGQTVVVLGAGGAALAAVCAVAELGVGRVVVRSRRFEQREAAAAFTRDLGGRLEGRVELLAAPLVADAGVEARTEAVIQATSAGQHVGTGEEPVDAVAWGALPASAVALDLVYGRAPTPFVRAAKSYSLRVIDGCGVLVGQGARALELWLGRPVPREVMARAVAEAR
ncbi:MAG: shikimate dehydrogenase [Myxococcales bacterium]|nr:shikimate dehydrogenase [Myxococcales bacterium]MBL0196530.1 shikimate dehydrogenase [Myxococcales bacterium]